MPPFIRRSFGVCISLFIISVICTSSSFFLSADSRHVFWLGKFVRLEAFSTFSIICSSTLVVAGLCLALYLIGAALKVHVTFFFLAVIALFSQIALLETSTHTLSPRGSGLIEASFFCVSP
jgi:uncharacterized membrane protein YbhN (UPF0104 family)